MLRTCIPTIATVLTLTWACSVPADGLVYSRHDGRHWQLWWTGTDGKKTVKLTDSALDKRSTRVLPGSGQIFFRNNKGHLLKLIPREGKKPSRILSNVEVIKDFDVHPAGGFLISSYAPNSKDNIRIWWYPPDTRKGRLVISDPHLNELPRWRPDGKGFLFVKSHQARSAIVHTRLEKPEPKPLWDKSPFRTADPAPDPKGKLIAYCRDGGKGMDLCLAEADGSKARLLHAGPGLEAEPCWSADGARIFFVTWDGKNLRIAMIFPNGRNFAYITPEGIDCRYPAYISTEGYKP